MQKSSETVSHLHTTYLQKRLTISSFNLNSYFLKLFHFHRLLFVQFKLSFNKTRFPSKKSLKPQKKTQKISFTNAFSSFFFHGKTRTERRLTLLIDAQALIEKMHSKRLVFSQKASDMKGEKRLTPRSLFRLITAHLPHNEIVFYRRVDDF